MTLPLLLTRFPVVAVIAVALIDDENVTGEVTTWVGAVSLRSTLLVMYVDTDWHQSERIGEPGAGTLENGPIVVGGEACGATTGGEDSDMVISKR
jgi:hypothetical protein